MITRLTEKIWIVAGGKNGLYPYSHSLYIHDGGGFLIDAGSDRNEIMRLRNEEGISAVLMSHCHEDHFPFLSDLSGIGVWATAEEAPGLESLDVLLSLRGNLGTEWETFTRELFLEKFNFRATKVTRIVPDGEELRFGKTRAIAMVTPGHAAGPLCLHFPDDGILFLGDYGLSIISPWYGDASGDIEVFRRSARRLVEVGAETSVVSHGEPVHRGSIAGKMEKNFVVIERRESAVREFLREPRSRAEIISRKLIYGPDGKGPWFDFAEWAIVSKHLKGMIARGEAILRDGVYLLT